MCVCVCACVSLSLSVTYTFTSFATFDFPSVYAHFSFLHNYVAFLSLSPCTCSLSLCCSDHEASHLFNFPETPPFPLPPQNKVLFIYIPVSLTLWKTNGALVLGGTPSLLFVVCCAVPTQSSEDTFIALVSSRYTGYKIYLKRWSVCGRL